MEDNYEKETDSVDFGLSFVPGNVSGSLRSQRRFDGGCIITWEYVNYIFRRDSSLAMPIWNNKLFVL